MDLQQRRVVTAEEFLLMDEEPTFEDVLQLVERAVSVMAPELDQIMFGSNRPFFVEEHRVAAPRIAGYSPRCALCDGAHLLDSCTMFTDLQIEDLLRYIKNTKLCLWFPKQNHNCTPLQVETTANRRKHTTAKGLCQNRHASDRII